MIFSSNLAIIVNYNSARDASTNIYIRFLQQCQLVWFHVLSDIFFLKFKSYPPQIYIWHTNKTISYCFHTPISLYIFKWWHYEAVLRAVSGHARAFNGNCWPGTTVIILLLIHQRVYRSYFYNLLQPVLFCLCFWSTN